MPRTAAAACTAPPAAPGGYTFRQGQDSSGPSLLEMGPAQAPADLAAACSDSEACAGFSSGGTLRGAGGQLQAWQGATPCDGFYERDLVQGEAARRHEA